MVMSVMVEHLRLPGAPVGADGVQRTTSRGKTSSLVAFDSFVRRSFTTNKLSKPVELIT